MVRDTLTRRRLAAAIATTAAVGAGGCQDAFSDGGDAGNFEEGVGLREGGRLTILLMDEDAEPVVSGVDVTVDSEAGTIEKGDESNDGGEIVVQTRSAGLHTVTAESTGGEFDPIEERVTLERGEPATVTLELEGATGTEAAEDDDAESDEDGSDDEADVDGDDTEPEDAEDEGTDDGATDDADFEGGPEDGGDEQGPENGDDGTDDEGDDDPDGDDDAEEDFDAFDDTDDADDADDEDDATQGEGSDGDADDPDDDDGTDGDDPGGDGEPDDADDPDDADEDGGPVTDDGDDAETAEETGTDLGVDVPAYIDRPTVRPVYFEGG